MCLWYQDITGTLVWVILILLSYPAYNQLSTTHPCMIRFFLPDRLHQHLRQLETCRAEIVLFGPNYATKKIEINFLGWFQ